MELKNKKVLFLGDSITEGKGASSPETCYVSVFGKISGAEVKNYGIGGTRIAAQADDGGQAFSVRYQEMDDDAALVVIFGGTNDFGHGTAPVGSPCDQTPDTYCGALNVLFRGLIEKYPEAALVVMTPVHRDNEDEKNTATGLFLSEYVALLRSAAEKYSIPVLDLYAQGGIVPAVPASKARFCPDGLHPNDEGHRLIARKLCAFLQTV